MIERSGKRGGRRRVLRGSSGKRLRAIGARRGIGLAGLVITVVASTWALSSGGATGATTASPVTRNFLARADARVEEANPGTNYGSAPTLLVRGGTAPDIQTYVRFRVQDVSGPVQSATVSLKTTSSPDAGTVDAPAIYATQTATWSETGITWANRPRRTSGALDDKGATYPKRWVAYDVTSQVSGDGTYAFTLGGTSANDIAFNSREALSDKPRLRVTYLDQQPPTASNLRATALDSSRVQLRWTAATDDVGVTGYKIFRDGEPLRTIGSKTDFVDATVLPGGRYSYSVRALDAAGNSSGPSNTARVTTPITLTFAPQADARVQEDNPSLNFGTLPKLRARGGAPLDIESFLRFGVSGLSGTIRSANLWLRTGSSFDGTVDGPAVYRTSSAWSETGITWANRPGRLSAATDDKGAIAPDTWVGYDVTSLLTGNGAQSFTLASRTSDGAAFYSREVPAYRPRLVVRFVPDEQLAMAAGDIACDPQSSAFNGGLGTATSCHQHRTSDLLVGAAVAAALPLGDLQYSDARLDEFLGSYDSSWGRVKNVTHPVLGNHEYKTSGAAGYFDYFNGPGVLKGPAGERGKGYYSYDIGAWHLIALNSECSGAGGCGPGSPQYQWLTQDLDRNRRACTLAYWHRARFSSGRHGNQDGMAPFWQALYQAGADVVLSAHDHSYERFAPQTPAGDPDPVRGIREFVVGTGGKDHYSFGTPLPNSEIRDAASFGVLALRLRSGSYLWQFRPSAGSSFVDSGSGKCHDAPPAP